MEQMNDVIIALEGVTKCYGTLKAVDDLHLHIHKGEIFGLLGPNGAGKTTTILMMLGLTEPTAGSVQVCGYNATMQPIPVKNKVGYMPDSVGFYDGMTALENLVYIGRLNGVPESEVQSRAREVMEQVGLGADMHKKTATYSRGMKQRLGLADVLIKQPEVIILDEPTLGIDPTGIRDFLQLIKQLSIQQGLTVLLSSHHLHHVQQVCDRVGIFVNGRMLAEGDIDSLSGNLYNREGYATHITVEEAVVDTPALSCALQQLDAVQQVTVEGRQITISSTSDVTPILVRWMVEKGYGITGVQKKEYGLDDIYQKYFDNNLTGNTADEKSRRFFQKSFFKRHKN